MVNGVKITLVYHLYCKSVEDLQVGTGNVYNEINRRCLGHFHDVFDDAVFCVCLDDTGNSELVQKAVEWIWSCGFKDKVVIKIKPNSAFCDAQTFYDEVVNRLSEFDGMVFFGHNKGSTMDYMDGLKQWIIFSYYACLDRLEEYVVNLAREYVACTYLPITSKYGKPFDWFPPGSFLLANPMKLDAFPNRYGTPLPKLTDRCSTELFFPRFIDICDPPFDYNMCFEDCCDAYWVGNYDYYREDHLELLSQFLTEERVDQYRAFYDKIVDGLP